MSTTPSPSEVARQWFEDIWIRRDPSTIHQLLVADGKGHLEPDVLTTGPDEFLPIFHLLWGTFPDMKVVIEAVTGNDTDACVRWRITGTHKGDGFGIAATGRPVAFRGITWFTVKDGKITEGWDSWNQGALLASLVKG